MTITTVAEFAKELKKSPDTLLEQLKSAGVAKGAVTDELTDADKQKLLSFLKASHGTDTPERKKITLVKKSTSEIKQADATGKARTIQVEVRKKRTFVKRDDEVEAEAPAEAAQKAAPVQPILDQAELARREEEARRQAEFIRRQEEELKNAACAKPKKPKTAKSWLPKPCQPPTKTLKPLPRNWRKPRPKPQSAKPLPRSVLKKMLRVPKIWTAAAAPLWPRPKPSAP
jgi:translation initiation factor IF-2